MKQRKLPRTITLRGGGTLTYRRPGIKKVQTRSGPRWVRGSVYRLRRE